MALDIVTEREATKWKIYYSQENRQKDPVMTALPHAGRNARRLSPDLDCQEIGDLSNGPL